MFLQNPVSFDNLFPCSDSISLENSRPVECFFYDLQKTVDENGLENLQILLLAARKLIYEAQAEWNTQTLANRADSLYQEWFLETSLLFDCLRTLTWAEKQQKAAERQMEINIETTFSFLPEEVPDAFFEKLFQLKNEFGFNTVFDRDKASYIPKYRELYEKCAVQPIPTMLLPVPLTIFSIDDRPFSNIYAYFKYKNRRMSEDDRKQVLPLFAAISREVEAQFGSAKEFAIPVFQWDKIEDRFCQHKKLSKEDSAKAKGYFAKFRSANGVSKKEEVELIKLPYGKHIRSLSKLCNLNVYITLNYSSPENIPAKAKRPMKQLLAGELLPEAKSGSHLNIYERYFNDLYRTIPSATVLSNLALIRYFEFPFQSIYDETLNVPASVSLRHTDVGEQGFAMRGAALSTHPRLSSCAAMTSDAFQ